MANSDLAATLFLGTCTDDVCHRVKGPSCQQGPWRSWPLFLHVTEVRGEVSRRGWRVFSSISSGGRKVLSVAEAWVVPEEQGAGPPPSGAVALCLQHTASQACS